MNSSQNLLQRHKSLYEQTYLALRSSILSGEIGMDERLVETQLAKQFRVSRTPIRDAIRRLQQENLLVVNAEGHLYVVKLSLYDAIKLYDCRIALEELAVIGACENATAKQLKAIERTLVQAENIARREALRSAYKLLHQNFRFHRLIVQSSDNPWLVPILDQLSNQTTLLRIQTLQTALDITDIHTEHRQVYEAIAHRNTQAAIAAMTHHLTVSQKRIVQIFQQLEQPPQDAENLLLTKEERTQTAKTQDIICPSCQSLDVSRNGNRSGKQNYLCKHCGRQFLDSYVSIGYSSEIREKCIAMRSEGLGFREIERQTEVNHNTVIRWVNAQKNHS